MIGTAIREEIENLMLVAREQGADVTDLLDIVETVACVTGDVVAVDEIRDTSRLLYRERQRLAERSGARPRGGVKG